MIFLRSPFFFGRSLFYFTFSPETLVLRCIRTALYNSSTVLHGIHVVERALPYFHGFFSQRHKVGTPRSAANVPLFRAIDGSGVPFDHNPETLWENKSKWLPVSDTSDKSVTLVYTTGLSLRNVDLSKQSSPPFTNPLDLPLRGILGDHNGSSILRSSYFCFIFVPGTERSGIATVHSPVATGTLHLSC